MDVLAIEPPAAFQAWLVFVTVLTGATGAVFAVAGWIVRRVVVPTLRHEIASQVQPIHAIVQRELAPNGHEHEGDPQDRGVALRTLALRTASRARRVDHELDDMQEQQESHEREHIRREADWPSSEKRRPR